MNKLIQSLFLCLSFSAFSADTEDSFPLMQVPTEIRFVVFDHLSPKELMKLGLTCTELNEEVKDEFCWYRKALSLNIYPTQGSGYLVLSNFSAGMEYADRYQRSVSQEEKSIYLKRAVACLKYPASYLYKPAVETLFELMKAADVTQDIEFVHMPDFSESYYNGDIFDQLSNSSEPLTTSQYETLIGHSRVPNSLYTIDEAYVFIEKLKTIKFVSLSNQKPHAMVLRLFSWYTDFLSGHVSFKQYRNFLKEMLEGLKTLTEEELNAYPLKALDIVLTSCDPQVAIDQLPFTVKCFLKRTLQENHYAPLEFIDHLNDYMKGLKEQADDGEMDKSTDKETGTSAQLEDLFKDDWSIEEILKGWRHLERPMAAFYEHFIARGYHYFDYINDYLELLSQRREGEEEGGNTLQKEDQTTLAKQMCLSLLAIKQLANFPDDEFYTSEVSSFYNQLYKLRKTINYFDHFQEILFRTALKAWQSTHKFESGILCLQFLRKRAKTEETYSEDLKKTTRDVLHSIESMDQPIWEKRFLCAEVHRATRSYDESLNILTDLIEGKTPSIDRVRLKFITVFILKNSNFGASEESLEKIHEHLVALNLNCLAMFRFRNYCKLIGSFYDPSIRYLAQLELDGPFP